MNAARIACLAFLAACAPSSHIVAPPPTPSFDLSGEWISSSGIEPQGSVVTIARPCGHTVTEWRFTHAPPQVNAILIRGAPLTGTPRELPIAEWVSGSTNTSEFELRGSSIYRLRYDARARRLRGTRDGDSVWFAPLRVEEPRDCRDAITVPAPFDLSGSWSTGSGAAEPSAPIVRLDPVCAHHPAAWVLQQTGDTVEAWSFPESFDQGIARNDPPLAKLAPARGRVSGLDVTIESDASHYRLRYDPASGHLRGTLNDIPFWAVRQAGRSTNPCPGIP